MKVGSLWLQDSKVSPREEEVYVLVGAAADSVGVAAALVLVEVVGRAVADVASVVAAAVEVRVVVKPGVATVVAMAAVAMVMEATILGPPWIFSSKETLATRMVLRLLQRGSTGCGRDARAINPGLPQYMYTHVPRL